MLAQVVMAITLLELTSTSHFGSSYLQFQTGIDIAVVRGAAVQFADMQEVLYKGSDCWRCCCSMATRTNRRMQKDVMRYPVNGQV